MGLSTVKRLLEEGIAEGLHLGGQLSVSHRGVAAADLAFGQARPGEAMTGEHLMLWLSVTKPVTAVAIARLWQEGTIDLDAPVAEAIPEFAAGGKGSVTTRHLLTHTGGVRLLNLGWPRATWDEVVAKVCAMKLEPRWEPGRKAAYHLSSSWFILGELIRRLDGRALDRYVREEIFEPLGMPDCWIGMPRDRFRDYGSRIAPVFNTEPGGPDQATEHEWTDEAHATSSSPGGGGLGPVRQLARFYRMLLGAGALDGVRLLSPQTVAAISARHRVGLFDHTFRHQLDWGLGLLLNSSYHQEPEAPYGYGRHASLRTFGHGGYRSAMALVDPDADLVACLIVNGTPSEGDHRRRFEAVCDALYEDLGIAGDRRTS